MLAKTDVARIYETVLSIPGMNDHVKIRLASHARMYSFSTGSLSGAFRGWKGKTGPAPCRKRCRPGHSRTLGALATELLEKAGLTEMNQKLQSL